MSITVQATFRSEQALAEAVDTAFAEALAEELAACAKAAAGSRIVLPETEVLIAQAGIATGPCPPDPKNPSGSARAACAGLALAGRAAWWLLKSAAYVTALLAVQTVRVLVRLATPAAPAPTSASQPRTPASDFLTDTSEEIRRRGWTQHHYEDAHGVCVLGAQNALVQRGVGDSTVADRSCDYLLATVGRRSVPAWNDSWARHEDHIHTALYRAAARARAAGD